MIVYMHDDDGDDMDIDICYDVNDDDGGYW